MGNRAFERQTILWLIVLTFLHGLWYAAIVQPWQAPDETWHYEFLRLIDQRRALPLTYKDRSSALQAEIAESALVFEYWRYRNRPTRTPAEVKAIEFPLGQLPFTPQAPLYYLVSLPLYWGVAAWPVVSQLYALRVVSIVLHCLTALFTYLLARRLFGVQSWVPYASAFLVALHPQYTYLSASYNNDALPPLLVVASLYALLLGLERSMSPRWLAAALVAGGLSLAAKRTAIGIVPVSGIGLLYYGAAWLRAERKARRYAGVIVIGATALAGAAAALALWFGPLLSPGLGTALRVGQQGLRLIATYIREPQSIPDVNWMQEALLTFRSFWGYFGWMVEQVPPPWYTLLGWGTAVCAAGGVVGLARMLAGRHRPPGRWARLFLLLLAVGLLGTFVAMVAQVALSPAYYGAQGRYAFPFISGFAILAMWGWLAWWPPRWQGGAALLALGLILAFDVASWATLLPFFYG